MVEALKDLPDNVVKSTLHGQLTKEDYEKALISDINDKLTRRKELRAYTEIASDCAGIDPGALWEDTRLDISHFFDWERGALVTDVEWMSRATKFFALLMPGNLRTFPPLKPIKRTNELLNPNIKLR